MLKYPESMESRTDDIILPASAALRTVCSSQHVMTRGWSNPAYAHRLHSIHFCLENLYRESPRGLVSMLGTYKDEQANTQELTAEKTGGEALHMLKGAWEGARGGGRGLKSTSSGRRGAFSNKHKGAMCVPSSPGLRCRLRAH